MRKQLSFNGFLIGFSFALLLPLSAFAAQVQVSLGVNSISPSSVTVNPGDTVVWTNTSATAQSVIGNNNTFQSGSIAPSGQFAATFNTSGTYSYYDNASGSAIVGTIYVTGNAVSTPSQTSNTTTAYTNPNVNYYPTTTSTSASSNPTVASLTAEVQALIAQINALEGNSGTLSTGVSGSPTYTSGGSCPQIGRVLSIGASGSDVLSLQQFLGVTPASGYYGSITQSSVEGWQASNNIISYGTPGTTGYGVVGPRTAAAIRLACSGGSTAGTGSSNSGSGVVSGFLQVSPISGTAPLTSTVIATVNTAASCGGATYTLDYGDGTPDQTITAPAGNCSQQNQSFQHTYQYGGTYTVTLSSGTHSTTATVTVSGPAGPSTSVTGTPDSSEASGSMSAFITNGPAPLATTFYVSCAAGLAYDVVFGDGTDLGSNGVAQSSCDGGLQSVAHTYTSAGSYTAQLVVFVRNSQGTISSQAVAQQGITVSGPASSSSSGSSATYAPPTLTPDVGSNPLAVSLAFQIGACASYSIQWGDGQTAPGTGPCGGSSNTSQSVSHTYAASGSYTVTLTRGSQTDTVGVSIAN